MKETYQLYNSGFVVQKRELTERRFAVLKAFARFTQELDYSPSIRELGRRLEIKSPSSVLNHLENLERDGYLFRRRRAVRPWEMTRLAKRLVEAA